MLITIMFILYIFMYLHQAENVHYSILYEECKCCNITVSGILTGKRILYIHTKSELLNKGKTLTLH